MGAWQGGRVGFAVDSHSRALEMGKEYHETAMLSRNQKQLPRLRLMT